MLCSAWHAVCVNYNRYRYRTLNDATRFFLMKTWRGPMSVQDAFIDVIGALQVRPTSGRQKGSLRSHPNPPAGGGEILRRGDGGKDLSIEGAAALAEERRRIRRHCLRIPLTMSVVPSEKWEVLFHTDRENASIFFIRRAGRTPAGPSGPSAAVPDSRRCPPAG